MKSTNADYGWDIDMTYIRALRVLWWRAIKHYSWRAIAEKWADIYPRLTPDGINGNQFFGMCIADCAAIKIGLSSYLSWPMN